jgi:hypothetical protein
VIAPAVHGPNVDRLLLAPDRPFAGFNQRAFLASSEVIGLTSQQKDYLAVAGRV